MPNQRKCILLIEDEPDYCRLVERLLCEEGGRFTLECAGKLDAGLARIGRGGIDAVLLDLNLPDSRGLATLDALRVADPRLPVVVVSASHDRDAVTEALQRGAQDYLVKGRFVRDTLVRALDHAIVRSGTEADLSQSRQMYKQLCNGIPHCVFETDADGRVTFINGYGQAAFGYTGDDVASGLNAAEMVDAAERERAADSIRRRLQGESVGVNEYLARRKDGSTLPITLLSMPIRRDGRVTGLMGVVTDISEHRAAEARLTHALNELRRTLHGTICALGATVELRDPYTAGHQRRVAGIAHAVACALGQSAEEVEGVHVAALLHDIGKIAVPAEILSKPTALTSTEYGIIQSHTTVGYNVLAPVCFPWPVAQIALQHHERLDGSGYPAGLRGDQIEPGALVLAVADTVEAMSSYRPYRPAQGLDKALAYVRQERGRAFDPAAVDACLDLFESGVLTVN